MTDAEPSINDEQPLEKPLNTEQRTLMGILAYLGPLVVIPYLMAKHDSFVVFHIRQGIVLFAATLIVYTLLSLTVFLPLYFLFGLLNLAYIIFLIIGVVHVIQKKTDPLPLIGTFAVYVKI